MHIEKPIQVDCRTVYAAHREGDWKWSDKPRGAAWVESEIGSGVTGWQHQWTFITPADLKKTKYGTTDTENNSKISGCCSASTDSINMYSRISNFGQKLQAISGRHQSTGKWLRGSDRQRYPWELHCGSSRQQSSWKTKFLHNNISVNQRQATVESP